MIHTVVGMGDVRAGVSLAVRAHGLLNLTRISNVVTSRPMLWEVAKVSASNAPFYGGNDILRAGCAAQLGHSFRADS